MDGEVAEFNEMVFENKWAILIGVNEYEHLNPLSYSMRDTSAMREALHSHLKFPEPQIFTFTQEAILPTRAAILQQLGELENLVNENDILFFYFSGHGFREGDKDYILPSDAGPKVLKDTALDTERVIELLSKTGCKNVVIFLDACRKEMGEKGFGIGDDTTAVGRNTLEAAKRAGAVTFFSCDPKDRSWEIDEVEHGAFTYCLLKAMRVWKCQTVGDINDYLCYEVPRLNKKYGKATQQPYVIVSPAEKMNLPIFKLPESVERFEDIARRLADFYAQYEIPSMKYYDKAIHVLEQAQKVAPDYRERRWISLVEHLCDKNLRHKNFERTWDAVERVCIRPPKIIKEMERLADEP